jgi:hypothetical protein
MLFLTEDLQLAEQLLNFLLKDSELIAGVLHIVGFSQYLDLSRGLRDREGAQTG